MTQLPRLDHVNVTVADLDATIAFFTGLGLELDARMTIEGEFLDTVVGMEDASTETVWLRPPGGGGALEVSRYDRPGTVAADAAEPNVVGLRAVCLEINDLRATIERLVSEGHELVGEVGEHEGTWLMAYVRGPEGIIVSLTERIG
ncbi:MULTISPECIES: VOC family protein [unclassified Aeromicrobium]|uniref:VOC family protein n=1 Tax=unclassified Aeromicrobium TaxID=2633570 RepID=UPI0006FBEB15|nr:MULTISPECIES: VOC family protein [unclassified Aeromicrobium]KQO37375.1 glyoxalase [Aeromicrobium sp. Leaf245]KQP26230.1 glyoxalase [Aeromicrobium sp. Leaf272]KQP84927.1 glyoxalase [Aeromicrobium sp. Leaf291]RYY41558.1 MAG: VOC family protein [Actinomycetales bacterium]